MPARHPVIEELIERDSRYVYEAYEFLFESLLYTQEKMGVLPAERMEEGRPEHHVSGRQLLEGMIDLARQEFGLMAHAVFHSWGLRKTDDVGHMVFNLVDAGLMSKTDTDSMEDFHNILDFEEAFQQGCEIRLDSPVTELVPQE